uniref:DH domain-containing protein n=3 Tax=Eptatretus burgeri TaxID=7764 RepID=A0A8C4PZ30_EPTBU
MIHDVYVDRCAPVNQNAFGQQLCVVVPGGATVPLLLLWHHTACDVLHIVCQLREDMELMLTSDETLLAPLAHPVQADTTNGLCTSPVDTSRTQGTQLPGQTRAYEEKIADMGEQSPPGQLSDADRLWKVIIELVETERSYVKDLKTLEEVYVRPLQHQSYLSAEQHEVLFGQLNGLQNFQLEFLQTLEQGLALAPTPTCCTQLGQFRRVLFSLGGSFLYYSDHFKLYSAYCASQPKAQRLLEQARKDEQLQRFLASQNPLGQHSNTLESFLIKPIQRVLKYPLLLRELVSLTDPESEENYHLSEALRAMNKVASHINEMQKIYEEFCPLLEKLASQHAELQNEPVELGMGDLLMNAQVVWLNPPVSLGQLKHLPEAHVFVFKKAVALICKDVSKQRKRKDDQDSSLFQYLIPVTALHVRALNDPELENACEWDLIHMKSETVGRPETVFRLCSRSVESKAQALRAARSLLRECARQRLNKSSSVPAKVPGYMPFGGRRLSALRARQQRATGMQRHLSRHSSDGLSQLGLGGEGGSVEEEGRSREAEDKRGSTNSTTALYRSEPELAIHHYCDSDGYDDISNAASVRQPAIINDLQADGGSREVCTNLDMPTVMVQLSLDEAEVRKGDVLSNVDTLQSCARQMQQSDGTTRDRKSPLTMHSGSDESLNSILSEAGTLEAASDRWHSDAE